MEIANFAGEKKRLRPACRSRATPLLALAAGPNAAQTRTAAGTADKPHGSARPGAGQWRTVNSFSTASAPLIPRGTTTY